MKQPNCQICLYNVLVFVEQATENVVPLFQIGVKKGPALLLTWQTLTPVA